ncbi:hypothetical protein RJP21_18700 [Paenibacillus sp. VCA1]|uniref:hypothetical protein n=1 Tax=Paenibacillus sp. VCA1 TaxID=3039148 RepID=UPI002870EC75|nr:hypothetical protein [Paenibacillus sp. VCA1]MDR9855646.1 hypothetical protein [Paenibacillus sp. VCA1]
MKKRISFVFAFILVCCTALSGLSSADPAKRSEAELNSILLKSGMPQESINSLDYDTKSFIIQESGENLVFGGSSKQDFKMDQETGELTEIPEIKGVILPQDYIPTADLTLTLNHFTSAGLDEIYSSFEWRTNPAMNPDGIYKDNFAIAVPDGWEIQSGKYAGAAQSWDVYLDHSEWSTPDSAMVNNGQPSNYSQYGASWSFSGDHSKRILTKYKGTVKLTMKKKVSTANQRVTTKYSQSRNNAFGSYGVQLAWGALSVVFNSSPGSNDEASMDLTW